jgi:SAM-dependent methyltransferase
MRARWRKMTISADSRRLYDRTASRWVRTKPRLLSDYSARPRVVEVLGDLCGLRVLDLGCGEGYMARMLLEGGASEVVGLDISREMISAAKLATTNERAQFSACDLRSGLPTLNGEFDIILAIFLFNYLTDSEVSAVMTELSAILRPGGRVVVTIPHPLLPHLKRSDASRAVFDFPSERPYLSHDSSSLAGYILDADGEQIEVLAVSRTIESILGAVNLREWRLCQCLELGLPDEVVPECFRPLRGEPLHMLFVFESSRYS